MTPSFGENVGIWVIASSPSATQVEVVSRQKGPVARLKNWEPPILHSIAANLGQLAVVKVTTPGARPIAPLAANSGATGPGLTLAPASRIESQTPGDLHQRREELRKYETLRSAELEIEKNPKGRERLQAELDYLREELRSVEGRISKGQQ